MPLILPNTIANEQVADGDKLGQNFLTIQDWGNQEVVTRDGSVGMQQPLLLPGPPTQPNQAATKAYVDAAGPVGSMMMYAGVVEPVNWMFCRGQAVSRATYAALFAVMGTRYGGGDGSTTFNVPNYQGTVPAGFNSQTNIPAGIGGFLSAGVGERAGSQHSALIAHGHSFNVNSGTISADHAHSFSGGTAIENAAHDHTINWGEVFHSTGSPTDNVNVFSVRVGDGITIQMEKFPSWSYPSGGENQNHAHGFSGGTAGVNTNHVHNVNGNVSNAGSSDGNNTNQPPTLTCNFIIKVF
jgi:microcystin-dependent protein